VGDLRGHGVRLPGVPPAGLLHAAPALALGAAQGTVRLPLREGLLAQRLAVGVDPLVRELAGAQRGAHGTARLAVVGAVAEAAGRSELVDVRERAGEA